MSLKQRRSLHRTEHDSVACKSDLEQLLGIAMAEPFQLLLAHNARSLNLVHKLQPGLGRGEGIIDAVQLHGRELTS